jgi:eukaryotic-like serine/threonine-protein kinase
MPLEPATRLGPYEIVGQLGAGGMGEVYRAKDTRLGRDVALKVLPADVANDPVRRSRFEQEARAVAALNHPNILGLFDVGSHEGFFFIVTELVPGETLGATLQKGPMPVKRLLDVAVQIADGMAAAHSTQITHRDLKPANVMVTGDGRVKILDFGLAKQAKLEEEKHDGTVTIHHTEAGMIVGTVNYMSPEQAAGRPVDTRSDQFSFGLMLYEMVTGKKAFERPSSVQTMSAILEDDPPKIEREIPAPLRWVIDRCLAKEPADRYESTRDLYRDLKSLREHLAEASTTQIAAVSAAPARKRKMWPLAAIGFAAGAVLAAAGTWLLLGGKGSATQSYRFTPFSFETGGQTNPVWSPDGKAVAYAARGRQGARYELFVRYLDQPVPLQLTKDNLGGVPLRWAPSGRIYFFSGRKPAGIWSIASVGGEPEPVVAIDNAKMLAVSPDAGAVTILKDRSDGMSDLAISSPPGSPFKPYEPAPFATKQYYNTPIAKFSPDGKKILMIINRTGGEEGWLLPYPPDASKPPKQVWKAIRSYGGTPPFGWMPDNRHVILSIASSPGGALELWKGDTESGELSMMLSGTMSYANPSISPDGSRAVIEALTGDLDVVSIDLSNAKVEKLIATERSESMAAYAKDGSLVYVSDRNGTNDIWLRKNGSERPLVTVRDFPPDSTQWFMAPQLSPDGDRVIYTRIEVGGLARLWISSAGGGAPLELTDGSIKSEFPGSWSPDGAWYAFLSVHDGQVSLMKVKTSGRAKPVALKEDTNPRSGAIPIWSPNGEWIGYYDKGEMLISSDGKTEKKIGELGSIAMTFSPDSKTLYTMHQDKDALVLFSVDIASGKQRDIGEVPREFRPGLGLSPAMRFSLAPDGKSFAYPTGKSSNNLWLMDGLAAKGGLFGR